MRIGVAVLFAAFLAPSVGLAQTNTATAFLTQVLTRYPAVATTTSLNLNGNATWISGALHESGSASLKAGADGSSTLQLSLETASSTETRTALNQRACERTDNKGNVHQIHGPDCMAAVAWFAPMLLVQPASLIAGLLEISDDGSVSRNGSSYRQISYRVPAQARSTSFAELLTAASKVSVLYEPGTLLPASVEYAIHADADINTSLQVRVVYSNYQTISGLPVPYQMDRYVNNALQLSITVGNASLN